MVLDADTWPEQVLELVYQPWNIEVKQYSDGGYFARVVELPGCMTEADTAAGVLEALEEARAAWIEAALNEGRKIPPSLASSDYSGKIFVRTSPELHRAVAEAAAREGVSMSQWASEVLAAAAARETIRASIRDEAESLAADVRDAAESLAADIVAQQKDVAQTHVREWAEQAAREVAAQIAASEKETDDLAS